MDPLSIVGAVAGGISITNAIVNILGKAISTASIVKNAPDFAVSTLRYVETMRATMIRFQRLLMKTAGQQRSVFLSLDDVEGAFLNCVMALDELESVLKPLCHRVSRSSAKDDQMAWAMSDRLALAMKDKRINQLIQRVRDAQSSLSLMLSIMQQESNIEVHQDVTDLVRLCKERRSIDSFSICKSHIDYSQGDDVSAITPASHQRSGSAATVAFNPRFSLEATLNASGPYLRAQDRDQASPSRSSALNMCALPTPPDLSSRSLDSISAMSFVALPIFCNDLSNPQHYTFGELDNVVEEDEAEDEVLFPFNLLSPGTSSSLASPSMPYHPIAAPASPIDPDTPHLRSGNPLSKTERQQGRVGIPGHAKDPEDDTDALRTGSRLFSMQEKFLRLQRRVFEQPEEFRTADTAKLESLQERKGASKVFLAALKHSQLALEKWSNTLSAWWKSGGKSDTGNNRQRAMMAQTREVGCSA